MAGFMLNSATRAGRNDRGRWWADPADDARCSCKKGKEEEGIMNAPRWWDLLLLAALAAGVARPAVAQDLAQGLAPAVAPANTGGVESGASIPHLSGIWGRNWFTLEPPSSGPGPIASKLRRPDGTQIFSAVGDYTNPVLRPQAAEVVKKHGEMELSGGAFPSPHNQCWPEPTPFTLSIQLGMQMIQRKDEEVILLYLSDHQVRHVRMNVPHSAHPKPTWQGESVGHYEGDTLVVDTIGQKLGPLSMVDRYGTPFSAALHVIERYRLIDGAMARDLQRKHQSSFLGAGGSSPYGRGDIDPDTTKPGLQVEITVDDPGMFTAPWSGLVTYRPVQGTWPEAVCAENTRGLGPWINQVPQAEKPDF
jgi:hypothetical protein